MESILKVNNLHVHYVTDDEVVKAVNGISFELMKGESIGLVGETGAGKTTTALSIMQLVPDPPGIITEGEIIFEGKNLIYNTEKENQKIRGNGISMIFQDPMTALNPIMTIGDQLTEVVLQHKKCSKSEAEKQVKELLETVGVKSDRFNDYPHQFSGGMKQRVVITMALLCNPDLLIADEPTTALDVTIQAQVLEIIMQLQKKFNMSLILITHDLGVVAETCDRVAILRSGHLAAVEPIAALRQTRRKRYRFTFPSPASAASFSAAWPGAKAEGCCASVSLAGQEELPKLLGLAANQAVTDISVDGGSLEDAFLGYYGEEV